METNKFLLENNYLGGDIKFVIGLDEAGRGPLAGPVCAGAVCFMDPATDDSDFSFILRNVRDSKLLTYGKREILYSLITSRSDILWGCAFVSSETIDKVNILEATKLAMEKAVLDLRRKDAVLSRGFSVSESCLIIDGNFRICSELPQFSIVGGDRLAVSISAASIVAKVSRDRAMKAFDSQYPGYGFAIHKGYGTKRHLQALLDLGPTPIHRKTFAPVARLCDNL